MRISKGWRRETLHPVQAAFIEHHALLCTRAAVSA
jgi:aerobic-type carbon monoxide dehydrogenase small subunit (CoxS/CutS family)